MNLSFQWRIASFSIQTAVVTFLLCACPGTGGNPNDAGPSDDGAEAALRAAVARLAPCFANSPQREDGQNTSREEIVNSALSFGSLDQALSSPDVSVHQERGLVCAAFLQEIADTCKIERLGFDGNVLAACSYDMVYQGSRAAGEACDDNRNACSGYCFNDSATSCLRCTDYQAEGDNCDSRAAKCQPGLLCRDDDDNDVSICVRPAPAGQPCARGQCTDDAYCQESTCATKLGVGQPCETDVECLYRCSFSNDGPRVCSAEPALVFAKAGEICGSVVNQTVLCGYWKSEICLYTGQDTGVAMETGICTAISYQGEGETCGGMDVSDSLGGVSNEACSNTFANYCHLTDQLFGPGVCRARAVLGEMCQDAAVGAVPCRKDLFCAASATLDVGECVAIANEGEICTQGVFAPDSCETGLDCIYGADSVSRCEDDGSNPICAE